jgi:WD40 repeat protein
VVLAGGKTGRIFAAADGKLVATLDHPAVVDHAALSLDGTALATAGEDGVARVWEVPSGRLSLQLFGHTDEVMRVDFCSGAGPVVTTSTDGTARLWSLSTGQLEAVLQGHTDRIDRLACSNDVVVTGSFDRS